MRFLRALVVLSLIGGVARAEESAPLPDGLYAEFATPRGAIVAELFYRQVPLTTASFVGLAEGALGPKKGTPFFNGLKFHRVVPNFVVQGGDPLGTGAGDPGYSFADEFVPGLRHNDAGILSMANNGPDTNGSQFFFTLREVNRLNYLHSVFGRVVRGREILPLIEANDPMITVTIRRIGAAAQAFRADQAAFDALAAKAPRFRGASEPGPAAHFDDPDHLLATEPPRALAFQRKLANFERATGRKVYARLAAKFTPAQPGQKLGVVVEAMARKIGLPADSVLAVYFADLQQWGLWIGDDYLAPFLGHAMPKADMMAPGGLHDQKLALFAAAKAEADLTTEDAIRHSPPGPAMTDVQRLKLQVDAVLDALLFKFEPKP